MTKTLFIPVKSNINIQPLLKKIKLNGTIGLLSSVQFLHYLEEANKIIKNSVIGGQILGCNVTSALKIKNNVDNFLFIGPAYFYPAYIAFKIKKPVYILNPLTKKFSKVKKEEISEYEKRIKVKQIKLLSAKKLGIIVSTKPGQQNLQLALNLQKKYKNSFIFLTNTLSTNELENFRDIDFWINTACSRIEDKNIINLEELPKEHDPRRQDNEHS